MTKPRAASLLVKLAVAAVVTRFTLPEYAWPTEGEVAMPRTHADRVVAARSQAALEALEALVEKERARPTGARVRGVIDHLGHRLVLFAARPTGAVERIDSFEPAFAIRVLYAFILDSERRVRLLLIEPMDQREAYEIDQYMFSSDGNALARDHTYGTFTDCADGRIHERRIITVFGTNLRVLQRKVEFLNELPGPPLTTGCALEPDRPPYGNAAALLRAHGLEQLASEAGLRLSNPRGASANVRQ